MFGLVTAAAAAAAAAAGWSTWSLFFRAVPFLLAWFWFGSDRFGRICFEMLLEQMEKGKGKWCT